MPRYKDTGTKDQKPPESAAFKSAEDVRNEAVKHALAGPAAGQGQSAENVVREANVIAEFILHGTLPPVTDTVD